MLWVLFNKKGQYIGQATQGNLPMAGTTLFQIFAVFQDIEDVAMQYNGASITFYKPDLTQFGSYSLPMDMGVKLKFHGESQYFNDNQTYNGCLFDFADFKDTNNNSYLDTPGLWRAVVTLLYPKSKMIRNVVGSVTFTVLNGLESETNVDIDINNILNRIYALLAQKLNIASPNYVKAISTSDINEYVFDSDIYNPKDVIFNRYDNLVYQLDDELKPQFIWSFNETDFIAAGFFEVEDYNTNTGEITLVYASELYDMAYNESTGILSISAI